MNKQNIVKGCLTAVFILIALITLSPLTALVGIEGENVFDFGCICIAMMAISLLVAMMCSEKEQKK